MQRINLLPDELKLQIRQSKKNKDLFFILLGVIFSSISLFTMIFYTNTVLSWRLQGLENLASQKLGSIKEYSVLEKKATNLDERLKRFKDINNDKIYFSKALEKISASTPSELYILDFKVTNEKDTAGVISGNALDKNKIASFINSLEAMDVFSNVDIESVTSSADKNTGRETNNFTISFNIDTGKLK